ncbi:hypothetical protein ES703_39058 [subsurface metagenome]
MLDSFANLTDQESKKKVNDFFSDLEYLDKIRILLREFDKFNITKLESRGIYKMWQALPLERQKDIFQDQWKYQK